MQINRAPLIATRFGAQGNKPYWTWIGSASSAQSMRVHRVLFHAFGVLNLSPSQMIAQVQSSPLTCDYIMAVCTTFRLEQVFRYIHLFLFRLLCSMVSWSRLKTERRWLLSVRERMDQRAALTIPISSRTFPKHTSAFFLCEKNASTLVHHTWANWVYFLLAERWLFPLRFLCPVCI